MAAGNWTVFNIAKEKLAKAGFNLDTDTFKMVLCTDVQSITAAFAGSSTDCRYADLTNEVANGGGYTTGGNTANLSVSRSGGTVTTDCDDQSWTSSTITAKYAVLVDTTTANDDLYAFAELDTVGSVSTVSGTLTVAISASGVNTLA